MPYQGDTTPNASNSAPTTPGTPATTRANTVMVIPAVDLFLGTVTIMGKAGTRHFAYPQPQLIAEALAQAVRPTRWCEVSKTLTVTVAAVGKREGAQRHFALNGAHPDKHAQPVEHAHPAKQDHPA
ncbi:conserved hypothetical protein [Arthrobacter sp. 9V]|uniref:hypothetical protein n=1 Tax=Arthrobacter sp. 9V TaxID=2653132 RepID=UPI0012F12E29|nr:hypothetical protein [Arthrobacter sp. 9V]VXC10028.1 conserved hypothetical protein [Arthrobacter sp. 9V]